jgi:hypothetical protein
MKQAARAMQIAKLPNDRLLQLKQEAEQLYSEIYHTPFSLEQDERPGLEAIQKEVEEFKAALEDEYITRLLRGYHSRFKKLLQGLQPPPQTQEAGGRLIIPINAAVAAQEDQTQQQQQQDALQTATTLAEQLRATLAAINGGDTTTTSADDTTKLKDKEPL